MTSDVYKSHSGSMLPPSDLNHVLHDNLMGNTTSLEGSCHNILVAYCATF